MSTPLAFGLLVTLRFGRFAPIVPVLVPRQTASVLQSLAWSLCQLYLVTPHQYAQQIIVPMSPKVAAVGCYLLILYLVAFAYGRLQ
jgi:hypothetical protein